jgi:hypothetical protein
MVPVLVNSYSDNNIPGPTIVQEQADTAIHGLTSRFGCFPNSNPGSSHVFLATSVSLSFRCGAI